MPIVRQNNAEKWYLDNLHLLLVIHVVDRQTSLVDEVIQTGVDLDQQLLC